MDTEMVIPIYIEKNGKLWAIEFDSTTGHKAIYVAKRLGERFHAAGDSDAGIPANAPNVVKDIFWSMGTKLNAV